MSWGEGKKFWPILMSVSLFKTSREIPKPKKKQQRELAHTWKTEHPTPLVKGASGMISAVFSSLGLWHRAGLDVGTIPAYDLETPPSIFEGTESKVS